MRHEQDAVLISLRRAQQFFDENGGALTAMNPTARKELDDMVLQLTTLAVTQDSGARGSKGETARNRALRLALRLNHMTPIAEMAKYKLEAVPELEALAVPAARVNAESLVSMAMSMADAAEPHMQTFIDGGLSPTFLDDLRTAAKAVRESIVERGSLRGRRNGATAGLAETERRGRGLLRVLTALVLPQLGDDAQLVREWTSAATVRRRSVRAGSSTTATAAESQAAGGDAGVHLDHTMAGQ